MQLEKKFHENVFYYTDVIENPEQIIDLIEKYDDDEEFQKAVPKWRNWNSSSLDGYIFGKKKDFHLSGVEELSEEKRKDAEYIISVIRDSIKKVAQAYIKEKGIKGEPNLSPFVGISKYVEGCAMGAHFDRQAGDNNLEYSIILYWNDDYEGGELSFIIRDEDLRLPQYTDLRPKEDLNDPINKELITFSVKPQKGSAMIFPSTDPYKHQVHIMKKGQKYMTPGFIFVDGYVAKDF